jgi:hypothetical protein
MKKLILTLILPFAFINQSFAAPGTASVEMITPDISVSENTPLNFGQVLTLGAGTVIISAEEVPVRTGTAMIIANSLFSSGSFNVTGDEDLSYTVTVPTTISLVDLAGTGTAIAGSLISSPAAAAGLLTSGAQTVYVGGTITVAATQAAGNYSATYEVTVAY